MLSGGSNQNMYQDDEKSFFDRHDTVEVADAFIVDVNGVLRGKRIPASSARKLFDSGLNLPQSVYAVDIWGQDVLAAGLVTETGDNDGICRPVPGTLKMIPWSDKPTAQVLLSMDNLDGTPFYGDPRHVLQNVLQKFARKKLTPVVATELEFYLMDRKRGQQGQPQKPVSPHSGQRHTATQVYSMEEMQAFDLILDDIMAYCKQHDIPADTTISENGPGQFEVNLKHVSDALKAADHAVLLKRVVQGAARKHGMDVTFMAKPYVHQSGNGMHVHMSVLDHNGDNILSSGTVKDSVSDAMSFGIGGMMQVMRDSMAVFAPNMNSYRRFAEGTHAPTKITWGHDNRSASLRVPALDEKAARIEHRVPGADANPYLTLAVMLGGLLHGLEHKINAGSPVSGDAYASVADTLPCTWGDALNAFDHSDFITDVFGPDYKALYLACKKQEKSILEGHISPVEYDAYL